MHVLTPTVFTLLEAARAAAPSERLGLSPALATLATREKYLAARLSGRRADLEARLGVFRAQLALGLHGPAREAILAGVRPDGPYVSLSWPVLVAPSIFRDALKDDGKLPNFKISQARWRHNFFCSMVKPEGSSDVSLRVPVSQSN
jgi:hypothetical protein